MPDPLCSWHFATP